MVRLVRLIKRTYETYFVSNGETAVRLIKNILNPLSLK